MSDSGTIDPYFNKNLLKSLKEEVNSAIKAKKTFTTFPFSLCITTVLEQKGWIQKLEPLIISKFSVKYQTLFDMNLINLLHYYTRKDYDTALVKRIIISHLLGRHEVDFIWFGLHWNLKPTKEKVKSPIVNKLQRQSTTGFTSKLSVKKAYELKLPSVNIPRCYDLEKQWKKFSQDFNITAAMSLLKYVDKMYKNQSCKIISPSGKIPYSTFEFALSTCRKFLRNENPFDKGDSRAFLGETKHDWKMFHNDLYKIVHFGNHFKQTAYEYSEERIVSDARHLLTKLSLIWPELEIDGYSNIWLLKPFYSYGAKGIILCQNRDQLMEATKSKHFVAQKYIERPLLIYDTKFDIRQWLVVTNVKPLTIWFCKDCYLRFCRETYSLRKLHEKIHFTNTLVQDKYTNDYMQDTALPKDYLWSCQQFKDYLVQIGYPDAFHDITYPRMKENILSYFRFYKKDLGERRNCFEIFGADFLITEDFNPWLLEINFNPSMQVQKPFFTEMIKSFYNDLLEENKSEELSEFGCLELIYKESSFETLGR